MEKGKKIACLAHGWIMKMDSYHTSGNPRSGESSKKHTVINFVWGEAVGGKNIQELLDGGNWYGWLVSQGPRRSKTTIFEDKDKEVWGRST